MSDLPDLEISKLPSLDAVNKDTDYLVVSKESTAYASGYGSFKVTPNQLMQAVSTTNLSDLGDVNISSPENEQVLRYDSSTNKWINSEDSGGTEVEANPAETATDTLTSIKIDNDVYFIEGGGSNVVANPTGTATDTLNKLQVDETIYRIEGGGGSSADHITLTQAEYDALVEAGTVDPDAFYFIKDTNGDGQNFQPVIYSLEEREVGVWEDGKPLYEKTVYSAGGVQGNFDIPHNISNIDRVIRYSGTVNDTDSQWASIWTIPRIASDSNNLGINWVTATNINVINPTAFGTRLVDWYITIQYTKTTDTAGSGTWTPQGVPAVHYSTDEQIVGTWIDGSTLYEKTINFGALPDSSEKSVAHNISNVDKIWVSDGFVFTSSNTFYGLVHTAGSSQSMQFAWDTNVDRTNVTMETYSDRSTLSAYVIVRYTKTSA